ncbi:MAG: PAS domain S-box protein, partial [Nitrospinales bacterium]
NYKLYFTVRKENFCGFAGSMLDHNRQIFESIVFNTFDGVIVIDARGVIRFANPAVERIFGYSADEITGTNISCLMPKPYSDEHDIYLHNYLKTGVARVIEILREVPGKRKDGTIVDLEISVSELMRGDESVFIGLVRDISARKAAEREILSLSKFPSENPSPVLRVSNAGEVLFRNRACDIFRKKWNCTIGGFLPDNWRETFSRALSTGKIIRFEDEFKGSWFAFNVVPIDKMGYVDIYGMDITDRKRIEEKFRSQARELQESHEEMENFAFTASHDLQEPLRKMELFADRLITSCSEKLDEKEMHYLERMLNAAGKMKGFIEDLLRYSSMSFFDLKFEPVSLSEVISGVRDDLEDLIDEYRGEIKFESLPTIEADKFQIRQLFKNLITNSLKYRMEGVLPRISIKGFPHEDGFWNICVKDNGVGFDEKYYHRIFQPFKRLHDKQKFDGTGMGLFVCKKIVDRHCGKISVKSQARHGTTFSILLPEKHRPATS